MENRLLKFNSRQCAKCIILLGVLTGLFFSTGEGLRLIPFSATAFSSHAQVQIDLPVASYQQAVQRINGSAFITRKAKISDDGGANDHVAKSADALVTDVRSFSSSGLKLSYKSLFTSTSFVRTLLSPGPPTT